MKKIDESKYKLSTRLIHGKSVTSAWDYKHHAVPPMTKSSTFRLSSTSRGAQGFAAFSNLYPDDPNHEPVYIYDRLSEPNNTMLQHLLAEAEEMEASLTFSTGMSAITAAVLFSLTPGNEVLSHKTVYGCTFSLFKGWLPRLGFNVNFADFRNLDQFAKSITPETRVVYLESPANPNLELLDLEGIADVIREVNKDRTEDRKIISVIDNTFATPFCQRPGKFGMDIVVNSLTKGLCGFGTAMGGAVCCSKLFRNQLILFRKDFGTSLAPDSAWHLMVYGLSTLTLRMKRAQESASKVAHYLENHKYVDFVRYPGLKSFPDYGLAKRLLTDFDGEFAPGSMIYFALKGNTAEERKAAGEKMMNFLADESYAITLAVSLGQARTLIEHPASMTHSSYSAEDQEDAGINPGGIRLAVGLEDPQDICDDLERAFENL